MPSPVAERPGLLIRDPFHYSDATLIIPPPLVACLQCFDGEQTGLELREALVRVTGELQVGDLEAHLRGALKDAGFLEDETFEALKHARHEEFRRASVREPAHAGQAYPDETLELRRWADGYLDAPAAAGWDSIRGIAAPHVSPDGGWESYRDAYRALPATAEDRTFVVLGTSHYGPPERFGLTSKPYRTPFGDTRSAIGMVEWLSQRAPGAITSEDYCHAVEHSIEFQVLFLQALYGPSIRVLPVLCGPFARSVYQGGLPEDDDHVRAFFEALGELAERERDRLVWVLGVDMAHQGARYGDRFSARAEAGEMLEVAARDRARIEELGRGDAAGFWSLVQQNQDDLKWCGSSPIYTFLKAVPGVTARLRRYQQWNIDEQSVVSFAAMSFHTEA